MSEGASQRLERELLRRKRRPRPAAVPLPLLRPKPKRPTGPGNKPNASYELKRASKHGIKFLERILT